MQHPSLSIKNEENISIQSLIFDAKKALSNYSLTMISISISFVFVLVLCYLFEPRWMTNDDVGLSMVAHGYGVAWFGTPNIIFSNVLWGWFVRKIPEINGILGYSIATMGVLVAVGATLVLSLRRIGENYNFCIFMLFFLLTSPVLFPQFTVNSGLLFVAAFICFQLYQRYTHRDTLVMAYLFSFLSYLIRRDEFILIFIIALPMLPWRSLIQGCFARIALLCFISAIIVSTIINYQAYQGEEWRAFNELNLLRAAFTDFGFAENLLKHPNIIEKYNFSINDVSLIRNWFFDDPKIANPIVLKSMLSEYNEMFSMKESLKKAMLAIQDLLNPKLLPCFIVAISATVLRPHWKLIISWIILFAVIFVIGFVGRPGQLRIYIPLIDLLLIASFFMGQFSSKWRRELMVVILFFVTITSVPLFLLESKNKQAEAQKIRESFSTFPNDLVISWGARIPFADLYPVLEASLPSRSYRLYPLGTFTLAPFSLASFEKQQGRGMVKQLLKEEGILILDAPSLKLLKNYCSEHFNGNLVEISQGEYGSYTLKRVRCVISSDSLSSPF